MITNLTIPPDCKLPSQRLAKRQFKKLGVDVCGKVTLWLNSYQDSDFRCVVWKGQTKEQNCIYTLPAFSMQQNADWFFLEDEQTQLDDGSLFRCNGDFYFIFSISGQGLVIRKIAVIQSEFWAKLIAAFDFDRKFEFILCKAFVFDKPENPFLGYVWSGYFYDDENDIGYRLVLPLFADDAAKISSYNATDLHYEALENNKVYPYNDERFIVKTGKNGTYVTDIRYALCP